MNFVGIQRETNFIDTRTVYCGCAESVDALEAVAVTDVARRPINMSSSALLKLIFILLQRMLFAVAVSKVVMVMFLWVHQCIILWLYKVLLL